MHNSREVLVSLGEISGKKFTPGCANRLSMKSYLYLELTISLKKTVVLLVNG